MNQSGSESLSFFPPHPGRIIGLLFAILLAGVWIGVRGPEAYEKVELLVRLSWSTTALTFGGVMIAGVIAQRPALATYGLFGFIFFGIAAREQIIMAIDPIFQEDQLVLKAFLLINAFTWIMLCSYLLLGWSRLARPKGGDSKPPSVSQLEIRISLVLVTQIAFIAITGKYIFQYRYQTEVEMLESIPLPLYMLLMVFIRPLLLIAATLLLRCATAQKDRLCIFLSLGSVALGIAANLPQSAPRYYVGTLYLGCFLVVYNRYKVPAICMAMSLATLVAPLMNLFRYEAIVAHDIDLGVSAASMQDYDAFSLICYGLRYTDLYGSAYGANILTAALFFIPRSIWPSKMEGSASYFFDLILRYRNDLFSDNLSTPLPVEAYFAFYWAGTLVIGCVFALGLRWLDDSFRLNYGQWWNWRFGIIGYSFVLIFFVTRGSLLAGVAYSAGFFAAIRLAYFVAYANLSAQSVGKSARADHSAQKSSYIEEGRADDS